MQTLKLIENFLNDENIIKIENDLRTFNPIKILTKGSKEELHSKVLSWLLNPSENHNFGDAFLKLFFEEIFSTQYYDFTKNESPELSVAEIRFSNFYNSKIKTELQVDNKDATGKIDILIINEDKGIVCVLENKTFTCNHNKQLDKYYNHIEEEFKDEKTQRKYIRKYIYLTPEGECPIDEGDHAEKYNCVGYKQISEMIDKILTYKQTSLSPYLKEFIESYKRVIETDLLGQNTSLDEIKEVCDKHKEIISLIKNRKGENKEITELMNNQNELLKKIIDEYITSDTKLLLAILTFLQSNEVKNNIEVSSYSGKTVIRFLPKDLLSFSKLKTSEDDNLWSTKKRKNEEKYGIFFEITNRGNEVTFQIVSGYKNNPIKNKLRDDFENLNKTREVKGWIILYSEPLFKSKEYEELLKQEDDEQKKRIAAKIDKVFGSNNYKESVQTIKRILDDHTS